MSNQEQELRILLFEAERWELGEGDHLENQYWEQGLSLYNRLSELCPGEERYRNNLLRCLLELGRDLKMSRTNLKRAQKLFLQAVRMEPEHSLACYRLGFLYYYDQRWEESALYFGKALQRSARYRQHRITDEQAVKALCYQTRAYQHLSRRSMETVMTLWGGMKGQLRGRLKELVGETESLMLEDGGFKSLRLSEKHKERDISEEEYERLVASGRTVLSFTEAPRQVWLHLQGTKRIRLRERPAEFLWLLMESERPLKGADLYEVRFGKPMPPRSTVVKSNINRIREELARHQDDQSKPYLLTLQEGYQWNYQAWPDPVIVYRDGSVYRSREDMELGE